MSVTGDLPDRDDDRPALREEIPNPETGVGIGARSEPDTFEPEEDPQESRSWTRPGEARPLPGPPHRSDDQQRPHGRPPWLSPGAADDSRHRRVDRPISSRDRWAWVHAARTTSGNRPRSRP